jgi:hypothetical protein
MIARSSDPPELIHQGRLLRPCVETELNRSEGVGNYASGAIINRAKMEASALESRLAASTAFCDRPIVRGHFHGRGVQQRHFGG